MVSFLVGSSLSWIQFILFPFVFRQAQSFQLRIRFPVWIQEWFAQSVHAFGVVSFLAILIKHSVVFRLLWSSAKFSIIPARLRFLGRLNRSKHGSWVDFCFAVWTFHFGKNTHRLVYCKDYFRGISSTLVVSKKCVLQVAQPALM